MSIVYRNEKGSELTYSEVDNNFAELKVSVDSKKNNFAVLPIAQGGTGQTTAEGIRAALGLPDDASEIEYLPAGAGAVATDVQSKLREISVTVNDYMTPADRVANDLAPGSVDVTYAILAALDFIGYTGKLDFLPGVYSSDPIDLRTARNLTLCGANDASEYPYNATGMTLLRIRSAGDVGIKTATPNVDSYTNPTALVVTIKNILLDCDNKTTVGINCARAVRIQGCTIQQAIQDGIVLESGTFPVWIDHVLSRQNGRDGIHVRPSFTTVYQITNTECASNSGNGFSIYDGSGAQFINCLSQSNAGNGFSIFKFDPAGFSNPIFLERLVFISCYSEANASYGFYTSSYNNDPATYDGKIPDLTFINCAFNSGTGNNAYLRGLTRTLVFNSPYLSAALDPLYNTVLIDDFVVEGRLKPKSILDLSNSTSGQIKFPATQNFSSDVKTLDDYEEGTWTARISQSQTNYFTTSGTTSARYQKVGNVVHCFVTYSWSDKGAANAAFRALIDDLPYTVLGGAYVSAAVGCSIQVAGGSTDHWHIWPQGGTKIALLIKNNNTTGGGAIISDLPAAGTLTAQFSYITYA